MKSHLFIYLVTVVLIASSCLDMDISGIFDSDEDSYPPSPPPIEDNTKILRVDIEPNPVIAGDSIQFTCVIKDSLDPAFRFQWYIQPKDTLWEETQENLFKIKAPEELGSYGGSVGIYNYEKPDKGVPYEYFMYEVVEK